MTPEVLRTKRSQGRIYMSRTAYPGSFYWAVLSLPFTCFAQVADDTVKGYAASCYGEIGPPTW
jgi:hypothetical protein